MASIRRLLIALAILAVPAVAQAQNSIAYRLGVGGQMTCVSSAPTRITTRGMFWCNSSDANKLYYTDPSGTSSAVGGASSLQGAYTAGGSGGGALTLTSSGGPLLIKDNSTPTGGHLLDVTDNGGTNHYFTVDAASAGSAVLDFVDGASASASAASHGRLIYNDTSHTFQVSVNGGGYSSLGLSWPLQNGSLSFTGNYGGTFGGTSVGYSYDTTNAPSSLGDDVVAWKTSGTKRWQMKYNPGTDNAELVSATTFVDVFDNASSGLRIHSGVDTELLSAGVAVLTVTQARTSLTSAFSIANQAAPGSPANGDIWTDSTQLAAKTRQSGVTQVLEGAMFTGTASTTVSTATTATVVGTGVGTLTEPANFCVVGKTIRAHVGGVMTTSGTPGNYTFFFKLGATTIATSGAFTPQVSATTKGWAMDALIIYRACGVSGTVMVDGQVTYPSAAGTRGVQDLNNNGSTTTINTTGSLLLDAQVTLGSASQTVVGTTSSWEVLN